VRVSKIRKEIRFYGNSFFCLAISLAASMFEGSGADNDNLSDTDAELYILGVKYKTPNGK
jgi:hypothetical protein